MRDIINQSLTAINSVIWHAYVIYFLLFVGIVFTIWTKFGQLRALTHGYAIVTGKFDKCGGEGSISHFQALSAALSATVGVGNIGGTALAISMGGPGALFWMWIVGILGMALKTVEVTVTMIYRQANPGEEIQGGPMWVVVNGSKDALPWLKPFAGVLAALFCVTLLISTFTGGLFFQAWNAANVTQQFFGVPSWIVGAILALIVGSVILGGIKRIGSIASKIVPLMCTIYMLAAVYVIAINLPQLPALFGSIFSSAFSSAEASGAFVGGSFGAIFSIGMQRAFFSSESGQGSSPIAHSAVKTDEPVREGVVAGLEPFIDTIIVCTMTGMVILLSGVWNRTADFKFTQDEKPRFSTIATDEANSQSKTWNLSESILPERTDRDWITSDQVSVLVRTTSQPDVESVAHLTGTIRIDEGGPIATWSTVESDIKPEIVSDGVFIAYDGAALAAAAFNDAQPGLGKWLVTIATWLFGISTMIAWSYYGEQGVIFLFGRRSLFVYRVIFCMMIVVSCCGMAQGVTELTNLSNLGTGVMLWVNIPITLLFASTTIRHYHDYFDRMKLE